MQSPSAQTKSSETRCATLTLPPRRGFTTASPAPTGQTNIQGFCTDPKNAKAFADMRKGEMFTGRVQDTEPFANTSPYCFIEFNNLMNFNGASQPRSKWTAITAGIYSHHLFVAEIAHELFP